MPILSSEYQKWQILTVEKISWTLKDLCPYPRLSINNIEALLLRERWNPNQIYGDTLALGFMATKQRYQEEIRCFTVSRLVPIALVLTSVCSYHWKALSCSMVSTPLPLLLYQENRACTVEGLLATPFVLSTYLPSSVSVKYTMPSRVWSMLGSCYIDTLSSVIGTMNGYHRKAIEYWMASMPIPSPSDG